MGGGDDFSNLTEDYFSNLMEDGAGATTVDITVIEASPYLTIMDINELPLGIIQEYVGMNNWKNAITFAGVASHGELPQSLILP